MIRLSTVNEKIQAVLSGAVTTNQLHCVVCYSDDNGTTYVGGSQYTSTNDTTAVDICAAPGASTVRDIDFLSIRNRDTAAATVTVMVDVSATDSELVKAALDVGDQLVYTHSNGWAVLASDGAIKTGASNIARTNVANTFTAQQSFTGTAATAPAIAGASDPNTGVFFPAADTIGIATGGSERLRIDTSGNISNSSGAAIAGGRVFNWYNGDTGAGSFVQNNLQTNAGYLVNQLGNTANGGTASIYSSASGGMAVYTSSNTALILGTNNVANHLVIDSTGNVVKSTATGGLGYGTGAGGTVTQATSKATAVTLNKPTGQITMNNASLAAGATVSFAFNNSILAATDTMIVSYVLGSGTDSAYRVRAGVLGGIASVFVENVSGAPLSEAIKINFAIIKGATS